MLSVLVVVPETVWSSLLQYALNNKLLSFAALWLIARVVTGLRSLSRSQHTVKPSHIRESPEQKWMQKGFVVSPTTLLWNKCYKKGYACCCAPTMLDICADQNHNRCEGSYSFAMGMICVGICVQRAYTAEFCRVGEHAGRYQHTMDALSQQGFGSFAMDHQGTHLSTRMELKLFKCKLCFPFQVMGVAKVIEPTWSSSTTTVMITASLWRRC